MQDTHLRLFTAMIWPADPEVPGWRDSLYAQTYEEAKARLIEIHGADKTFIVTDVESSNKPR